MRSHTELDSLDIDWEMTPEEAVTLYLEWGNNSFHVRHKPVTSKKDFSMYFVVNTWTGTPEATLVRRNFEEAVELARVPLPAHLARVFMEEIGGNKGVYAPTEPIKRWLRETQCV
jgi:hypothetical protein